MNKIVYWAGATAPAMRTVKKLIAMCSFTVPAGHLKTVSFGTDENLLPPPCEMCLRFDEATLVPPPYSSKNVAWLAIYS